MASVKKKTRLGPIRSELIKKSREAALAAVQIFNNPNITFKSESYIVLMTIAWTYLMHAYYRGKGIDYRYFEKKKIRKRYHKTNKGAYKYWELERCLNDKRSPVDNNAANNLRFLIGLRHEIEHQMTNRIDHLLSARFQACCLNYNDHIKKLFSMKHGIDKHLTFSLQFSTISTEQKDMLQDHKELPAHIRSYIKDFDESLTDEEFGNERYSYRILFVPKTANRKGQADRVIEFVKADDPLAENVNREYAVIKETEKKKYQPMQIVKLMKEEGFLNFGVHHHTRLWQSKDAQKKGSKYGVVVAGKHWHWYENWVDVVRKHCEENRSYYC